MDEIERIRKEQFLQMIREDREKLKREKREKRRKSKKLGNQPQLFSFAAGPSEHIQSRIGQENDSVGEQVGRT